VLIPFFFVTSQSSWQNSAVTTDLFFLFLTKGEGGIIVQFIDCQAPGAAISKKKIFTLFYFIQVTFRVLFAQPWLQSHALTSQLLGHTKMKHYPQS